jgi:hypothetical protein
MASGNVEVEEEVARRRLALVGGSCCSLAIGTAPRQRADSLWYTTMSLPKHQYGMPLLSLGCSASLAVDQENGLRWTGKSGNCKGRISWLQKSLRYAVTESEELGKAQPSLEKISRKSYTGYLQAYCLGIR